MGHLEVSLAMPRPLFGKTYCSYPSIICPFTTRSPLLAPWTTNNTLRCKKTAPVFTHAYLCDDDSATATNLRTSVFLLLTCLYFHCLSTLDESSQHNSDAKVLTLVTTGWVSSNPGLMRILSALFGLVWASPLTLKWFATSSLGTSHIIRRQHTHYWLLSSNAGYCFIDFASPAAAAKALSLNGSMIPNTSRPFKLNWASGGGLADRRSDSRFLYLPFMLGIFGTN